MAHRLVLLVAVVLWYAMVNVAVAQLPTVTTQACDPLDRWDILRNARRPFVKLDSTDFRQLGSHSEPFRHLA